MHNAPAVDYPVGRSCWWVPLALLPALPLAALMAERWARIASGAMETDSATVALSLATLGWLLAAIRTWLKSPQGWLHWDPAPDDPPGFGWRWSGDGGARACRVRPVLDLQSAWLLHLSGQGGARWIWVEARRLPPAWADLRRAVWASRGNPDAHDRSGIFPRA